MHDRPCGRDGRYAELRGLLEFGGSISVGEYMERYGVGQKRAVAELRRFPGLTPVTHGGRAEWTGRRKGDRYAAADEVGEIQSAIGATPGAFPYVTRDEVVRWIHEDAGGGSNSGALAASVVARSAVPGAPPDGSDGG